MGALFLFTVSVDDLNNGCLFIAMSCCLGDICIENLNVFTGPWECLIFESLVYFI